MKTNTILPESKFLFEKHFSAKEIKILEKLEEEIERNSSEYNLDLLWKYDAKIGKIGAYSMPANPVKNPFPSGIARTIYRPLQYARAQMDIMDINMRPRNIIRDVGLHLEGLNKYIIKKETRLKAFLYRKATLGKTFSILKEEAVISSEDFESCDKINKIYNISKHNISTNDNKASSFVAMDAIIFYLVVRKIGNSLIEPYYKELCGEIGSNIHRVLNFESIVE